MKTERFPALLLALLLVPANLAAGGHSFQVGGLTFSMQSSSDKVAAALAEQVGDVEKQFDDNRSALRTVQGPDGKPAFLLHDVTTLIAATERNLDQAIERIPDSGLEALRAWSTHQIGKVQRELTATDLTVAAYSGSSTPRAIARVANRGCFPVPVLASAKKKAAPPPPPPPPPPTVAVDTANRLLDEVGEVARRIFVLGDTNDLEVTLWVGSTPAPNARFRYWPQGEIEDSAPAVAAIKTNGKVKKVKRGLYAYHAELLQGQEVSLIRYSSAVDDPAAGAASERLDLVNGSSFFCCRFDEHERYCHHVDSEKECR